MTAIPQFPVSKYELSVKRLAKLVSLAAMTDVALREFVRSSVGLAASSLCHAPSSLPELLDAAMLFQLLAGCCTDDAGSELLLNLLQRVLKAPSFEWTLRRLVVQLFGVLCSLIELWEERRSLPGCVIQGIVASLSPICDTVVQTAARDFAASAILRMRHLIPASAVSIPADASPRLVAAFLALQQHHNLLRGPVVMSWTFAAVAAATGGPELARELLPSRADGNLDALLVLRVCKVAVPNLRLPEARTESEAARLVEV
jgi:hypothetical protein